MFIWRVDAILAAFREFMPEFYAELETFGKAIGTRREKSALVQLYHDVQSISIDYAVMEKPTTWPACAAHSIGTTSVRGLRLPPQQAGPAGNVAQGLLVARDSANCVVDSDAGIVAALGVKDLVIVRAGDAVLVAHRKHLGRMKQLLAEIAGHAVGERHL